MKSRSLWLTALLLIVVLAAGCRKTDRQSIATGPVVSTQAAGDAANATVNSRQELSGGMVVEVRGLRVVAPPSEGEGDQMRAFNWSAGTNVAVVVSRPSGGIIAMDRDASEISSFQDNLGTDLWSGPKASDFSNSSISMQPSISEDGTAILFEIAGQAVPQKGASTLTVEGEVQIQVATAKTSDSVEGVTMEPDATLTLGSRTLKITKTGKPTFGNENQFAVTLEVRGDATDVAEIAFFDADGNNLDASRRATLWSGSGDGRVNQWEYVLESNPGGPVKVVLTRWTDLSTETVPLSLTFGVGL